MTKQRERRYSRRHHFPDGKVSYEEDVALGIFKQYSGRYPLNDLNKSGLCFQTDKNFDYGDKIRLKIEIPGRLKIQVVGEVRWVSTVNTNNSQNVGIQFLPFGTIKGYNTFTAREKLEKLINPMEPPISHEDELPH
jgi:Tfp pilus assembly protein PilZ